MIERAAAGIRVDVRELTETAPLGALHVRVLAICFATAVIDGLDNQAIGFSAASIGRDLGIALGSFGPVFASGVLGGLLGAVSLGMLADRIGRKKALILCTLLFAGFTLCTAFASSVRELLALRFLAGLGLGGAMPGFLSIASEYSPQSRRALATGILWCGYPVGGMIGGIVGSYLIPLSGWRAVFYLGAALGALVALIQWTSLPESLHYLALRGRDDAKVRKIAMRLVPKLNLEHASFFIDAKVDAARRPLREIFADGRALPTLAVWMVLFLTFLASNFFVVWAPPLLKRAGLSVSTAALMLSLWNLACIPSQATTGYLVDRIGPFRLLPVTYAALGLSLGLLGLFVSNVPAVAVLMMASGFLVGPAIAGMLFVATVLYPSQIRSTGVGWALGIGRSGQICGSLLIGAMVNTGLGAGTIITRMAIVPWVACAFVLLLAAALRRLGRRARGNGLLARGGVPPA
jgi:AAHS family 4-hydroxybenzoate transporter-like MFS transporter